MTAIPTDQQQQEENTTRPCGRDPFDQLILERMYGTVEPPPPPPPSDCGRIKPFKDIDNSEELENRLYDFLGGACQDFDELRALLQPKEGDELCGVLERLHASLRFACSMTLPAIRPGFFAESYAADEQVESMAEHAAWIWGDRDNHTADQARRKRLWTDLLDAMWNGDAEEIPGVLRRQFRLMTANSRFAAGVRDLMKTHAELETL